MPRPVAIFAGAVFLLLIGCSSPPEAVRRDRPPRGIVLIVADDLGIGDIGAYNAASKIPTPNFDAIAGEGIRFLDAHSPSAVCTPTRYGIMTGTYAWRTRLTRGVLVGDSRSLIDDRTTIAERLRDQGHATACIGKWHLGLGAIDPEAPERPVDFEAPIDGGPHTEGFEHSFIIPASLDMPPYVWIEDGRLAAAPTEQVAASRPRRGGGGGFWRAGAIAPGFEFEDVLPTVSARATAWIEARAEDDRPFFLYMPLPAPHTPWMPVEPWVGRSGAGPYGDFVAQVDAVVGDVVAALQEIGALDDTLIIVTSDNGAHWTAGDIERFAHRANGPYRGQKADIFEGGHRVPLLVRWPGEVPSGATSDALVGLQDVFATFDEIVGAEAPERGGAEDSVSFLAAMRGGAGTRRSLVHHSFHGTFAIRHGRWKLIEGLGSGGFTAPARVADVAPDAGRLFDLAADPGEQRDLFDERPDVVADLRAMLARIRAPARVDG